MDGTIENGVVAFDWFEGSGCVRWTNESHEWFAELERSQTTARESHHLAAVTIGERELVIYGGGIGSGRQSRLEYRLEWQGVTIALSARESKSRQLSNYYFKIPGTACLLIGAEQARDVVHEIVGRLGGELFDEWFKRFDVCLDLPGVNIREQLIPAIENAQFMQSAKEWQLFVGNQGKTGFAVGNRKNVRLNVYDKFCEVSKKSPEYLEAMKARRWGGHLPSAATRVEYTITKSWLDRFGISNSGSAIEKLPEVMTRLLDGPYVFFRMTELPLPKGTRNQGRVPTLPLWAQIADHFKEHAGNPKSELQPIRHGEISLSRLYATVRGYITSAAVQMRMPIECFDDAIAVVRELHKRNESTDDDWQQAFKVKARKSGLLEEMTAFPFGRAA